MFGFHLHPVSGNAPELFFKTDFFPACAVQFAGPNESVNQQLDGIFSELAASAIVAVQRLQKTG